MGVSGNDSCCSQLVKYGMFISNLIIFVSIFLHFGSLTPFALFRFITTAMQEDNRDA